jgi:transposase
MSEKGHIVDKLNTYTHQKKEAKTNETNIHNKLVPTKNLLPLSSNERRSKRREKQLNV